MMYALYPFMMLPPVTIWEFYFPELLMRIC